MHAPPFLAQIPGGIDPAGGGPLAYLGTFLLATVFYGVTLHIAARYVLGTVPVKRAFTIGPVLALVSVVLQRWGPLVVVPFMVAVAYTAILIVYDLDYKLAALVAVAYYTVAVIVGFTILNLWLLLGTAPA
ncbi:hypothetical protein ACFQS4_15505 [Saliphagus sp. GCM10025317]